MKLPIALACVALLGSLAQADSIRLDQLSLDPIRQDRGRPAADKTVGGHAFSIAGKVFDHGVGVQATSLWWIDLGGAAQRFTATVGLDDEIKGPAAANRAAVEFKIIGDRKTLFSSARMRLTSQPQTVDLDLTGVKTLVLLVSPIGNPSDYMHADWADAAITFTGHTPTTISPPAETSVVLTPKPRHEPRINGAKILGVRPGHPVLYAIAATGDRPMVFAAQGLPAGLTLDPATGQISGSVPASGEHVVSLTATNALGSATAQLKLEIGPAIALTPQMGWNSWNCFAAAVSDEKVRAAADAMVASGLIQHGWTYINIDDCWEVRASEPPENRRTPDGHIKTNKKFPDMAALAAYIHSKGLRAGLYSSPGPSTCGGYTASYQFEQQDAAQYAAWGFDYLKYDWCSYDRIANIDRRAATRPAPLDVLRKPYLVMRNALLAQDRDILFSFCQYGMGNVWEWGAAAGGNSWRTTGDIRDTWSSMSEIGFNQAGHEKYAGPGHWNDPDMLVVGKVGWGPALHPTHLTPSEQYTHITLWCMLDAPLLIGCDMTQLDDFTTGLLSNDDVIAVNQDPLGRQAARIAHDDDYGTEIWAKDLSDGSKAIGLFNRSEMPGPVTVKWSDIGLSGKLSVRDLWRELDLGEFDGEYSVEIPRHGAVMIKVAKPTP